MPDIQKREKKMALIWTGRDKPALQLKKVPVFHKSPLGIPSWWQHYFSIGGNGSSMRMLVRVTMAATKRRNGLRKISAADIAYSLPDTWIHIQYFTLGMLSPVSHWLSTGTGNHTDSSIFFVKIKTILLQHFIVDLWSFLISKPPTPLLTIFWWQDGSVERMLKWSLETENRTLATDYVCNIELTKRQLLTLIS